MFAPVSDLSQNQVGRFIPTRELNEWHNKMKQMYPQVYPADDKLFGDDGKQHSFGTKLKTFFDGDGDDEISEIPLTGAHVKKVGEK